MFNPAQIKAWRKRLEAASGENYLDGHYIETAEVAFGTSTLDNTESMLGTFYPPARIFGVPSDPSCFPSMKEATVAGKGGHLLSLPDARVIGFNSVLSEEGRLFAPDEVSRDNLQVALNRNLTDYEGFFITRNGDGLKVHFAARAVPRRIRLKALFLRNLESGNYGSFIFRQLPQLIYARKDDLRVDCYIAERTPWFLDAVDLLGLPQLPVFSPREISGEIFEEILFYSTSDTEGFIGPEVRAGLAEVVDSLKGREGESRPSPLYVSRSLSTLARPLYRPMLNECSVEELAMKRGFSIVYPETLSFREQVVKFSRATAVVGPSGSGMLNTVFAPPSARVVDIETYTSTVRQHARIYSSCGHAYGFAFCPVEASDERPLFLRRWHLPEEMFEQAIEWVSA